MTESVVVIRLSSEELKAGRMSSENIEKALVGFEKDGVFVVENAVEPEHLDKLNARMVPELKQLFLRETTHINFGKGTGNIQQEPIPFAEYLFEDVIANRFVSDVTECILGPKPVVRFYSSNTAFRGTKRQPVHIDTDFEFKDHCFGLCVNTNLVTVTPKNGSTELWPGSHRLAKDVGQEDEVPESLRVKSGLKPHQLSLPKGAVIVRDFRLWHAGIPNSTDTPRVMLVTVQMPHWYRSTLSLTLPQSSKLTIDSFNSKLQIAVNYCDDDYDYLKGSHNHTFAQTF